MEAYPINEVGEYDAREQGNTTHLSLWPASPAMVRWLEADQGELGLQRPGLRVLELGSGCGLVVICLWCYW